MASPPSKLLNESAEPFDNACMQVRLLEEYAVNILDGRDYHRLKSSERNLFNLLSEYGLVHARNGFVRKI